MIASEERQKLKKITTGAASIEARIHRITHCYHPLFVFNQFGDLERYALRAGNVRS